MNRFISEIPRNSCLRRVMKLVQTTHDANQVISRHGWCSIFCQNKCMYNEWRKCSKSPRKFCDKKCKASCYYLDNIIYQHPQDPFLYPAEFRQTPE